MLREVLIAPSVYQVLLDLLVCLPDERLALPLLHSLLMCFHVYLAVLFKQIAHFLIDLLSFGFAPAWGSTVLFLVLGAVASLSLATMDLVCSGCSIERGASLL